MKVYIVLAGVLHEGGHVLQVFAHKKHAEKYMSDLDKPWSTIAYYEIEEWDLNEDEFEVKP